MRKALPFLVVALTLACRHGQLYQAEHFLNPCPGNGHSTNPPIVCISPDGLTVSQNPVHLNHRVFGHFFITGGKGHLTITCDPAAPIDYVSNAAPDHVIIRAKPVGVTTKEFEYKITIDGKR